MCAPASILSSLEAALALVSLLRQDLIFFVSVTMKMLLAHLIDGYDIRLANPSQAAHINVRKLRVPTKSIPGDFDPEAQ